MRKIDKISLIAGIIIFLISEGIIIIRSFISGPIPKWVIICPFAAGALIGTSMRFMMKNKLNKKQIFLILAGLFMIVLLTMLLIPYLLMSQFVFKCCMC